MIQSETDEKIANEEIEIQLLLEAINMKYGYDFRNYSNAHMERRIHYRMSLAGIDSISEMQHKILYDVEFFNLVLSDFSINVTEMFRDPSFYRAFRKEVIPILKTYPFIKIWHAGCSTGEEIYSMAILLKEEGLYDRSQIYATDFNKVALQKAKEGIYNIDDIKEYTYNYQQAGGQCSFSDYYIAQYNSVIFEPSLKKKITFAEHNLVTDGVFGEMHVIICRNVMIYFNKKLQSNVIKLFSDSLSNGCFLCLGSKESIKFSTSLDSFEEFISSEKIYRKKYYL
ncbi:protein-glutamate O-methyltransferase CheR [Clostridium sp. CF012]|uniref:CheR family methyltransferase n=1 Tax=Clostridium sp. CF012 TaxID=2843319 RepID=UPI001C0BA2F5|nr:protein-glutamate O-methyltransferase CheR [Clostridium sp. CF012]MBU3144590.1 protein-glutamate O-methyltransferase CheR [Clostridium sp. CF012]